MAYQATESMDYDIWRQILDVNLLAPFRLTIGLRANLLAGVRRTIVMMSSDLGSIAQNQQGGAYAYRSSKAALNMITRGLSAEWRECIVVAMAPGWCRTRLGGAAAPVDPADSVRAQLAVIGGLTLADTGKFLNRFGEVVPW
jgi:NAD(P)-dependent dehydrogenase (short-subunit alcohol dehydrogenase family)